MSRLPKRVWSGKKLVFSGKKAVREKDWQIWVYNPKFDEIDSWEVYTNKRETLDPEAPLDVYDSSKPEYIWTMEDGILATYTFYDHNRSVLKQDTCKDGETPIPPADPTRESDWEYDYQFAWWDPEVWPIAKDTDYVALYNATKRIYTVSVSVNDSSYGSVDITELTVEAWTEILDSSLEPTLQPNQLMIWSTVVTATAESWYEFDYWTNWSQVITWDEYPQAVFKVATPIITVTPLTFLAGDDNSTIYIQRYWTQTTDVDFEVSVNYWAWTDLQWNGATSDTYNLDTWEVLQIRNKSTVDTTLSAWENDYYNIKCDWALDIEWDITTLLNKNGTDTLSDYCFISLFEGSTGLQTAPDIRVTTVWNYSCCRMFYWCTYLDATPTLTATTIWNHGYEKMFYNTALTFTPYLPATNIWSYCYYEMFKGCTALFGISVLPATTIPEGAYKQMYQGCTSLKMSNLWLIPDMWYVNSFRVPTTGTGTAWSDALYRMFQNIASDSLATWNMDLNTEWWTNATIISDFE